MEQSEKELLENDISDDELKETLIEFIDFMDDETIEEVLKMSMLRVGRKEKLARLGGSMASRLAKTKNDADYKKMIKYKKLWKKFKSKVMRKYGMRGKQAARKAAMKSK